MYQKDTAGTLVNVFAIIVICFGLVWTLTSPSLIALFVTLPELPSGNAVIGNSDVILASSFNATDYTVHYIQSTKWLSEIQSQFLLTSVNNTSEQQIHLAANPFS